MILPRLRAVKAYGSGVSHPGTTVARIWTSARTSRLRFPVGCSLTMCVWGGQVLSWSLVPLGKNHHNVHASQQQGSTAIAVASHHCTLMVNAFMASFHTGWHSMFMQREQRAREDTHSEYHCGAWSCDIRPACCVVIGPPHFRSRVSGSQKGEDACQPIPCDLLHCALPTRQETEGVI